MQHPAVLYSSIVVTLLYVIATIDKLHFGSIRKTGRADTSPWNISKLLYSNNRCALYSRVVSAKQRRVETFDSFMNVQSLSA